MKTTIVQAVLDASEAEERKVGEQIIKEGYSAFYELQEYLKDAFKRYDEKDEQPYLELLNKVRRMVPEPGAISPSWSEFWEQMDRMVETKRGIFGQVQQQDREGEWQVILDNPYSHQNVACYPQLSFLEGAYLYSYFRLGLKKNEYVRLQKINTHVMTFGE